MKFFTTNDLAEMFNVSPMTIRREVQRERINCFYVGNEARFTEQQVRDYARVKENAKTERELNLEESLIALQLKLQEKEEVIKGIKELLLRQI